MLRRGVARHAVVDDVVEVRPQFLGEAIAPGLAFRHRDVVGRRAAVGRDHRAVCEAAGRRIAAARAFGGVADREPGGGPDLERGDRHGLQERIPAEARRLRVVRRQQRHLAERCVAQGVRTEAPGKFHGRQRQHGGGRPRPRHQDRRQGEQRQHIEEVEGARTKRRELAVREQPERRRDGGHRQQERECGDKGTLEAVRTFKAGIAQHAAAAA